MNMLRNVEVLSNLTMANLQKLRNCIEEEEFNEGDVIVRQGTNGDKFYLIVSGTAKVYRLEDETKLGGTQLGNEIAELTKNMYFGEGSLLKDAPRFFVTLQLLHLSAYLPFGVPPCTGI